MLTAAEKITRAKSLLVIRQPFLANLVLRKPIAARTDIPTAGADAKGRIFYNPAFVDTLTVEQTMFLLAHESLHIAFLHCFPDTVGSRDPRACNVAMDKVINETLITEKCGEFVPGGQRHSGAETMKWQDLYVEPPEGDGKGNGPGGIGEDLLPCDDGEPTGSQAEEIKQQIKAELVEAANSARVQGALSGNLARVVNDLVHVKIPYHVILERFMQAFVSADYSWKRPNRRFVGLGLYLPSLAREPRMGKMVLGVDTSGSIGQRELDEFSGHLNRLLETCLPEEVHVVYCDSHVAHTELITSDEYPVKLSPHGGGGTDMRRVWAWADEHVSDADCLVLLTDGYTPWPQSVTIPSLVVCTTDECAPAHVAETVHV